MRNLAALKQECQRNGINVVRAGKREAKSDYEKALAQFYWKRDYPDQVMPPQLHPMLARNFKDLEDSERDYMWASTKWVAQEKINGCRLLMFIGNMGNHFTSRRLSDKTYRYSENTAQVPHLAGKVLPALNGTVLDGEIICPKDKVDTGKTITESALQATVALLALNPKDSERVQREQNCRLVYKVFDVLYWRGRNVMNDRMEDRMNHVADAIVEFKQAYPDIEMEYVPLVRENKKEFYEDLVKNGKEGIMLKDVDARYEPSSSRTKAMYKVKRFEEVDAFVTGFARGDEGAGWEKLIGKLELSAYDEKTGQLHAVAWCSNMTFEERTEATCCPECGKSMTVQYRTERGQRIVETVRCVDHGELPATLNVAWFNRVYIVKGQDITPRVFRLSHATLISRRGDKAPEDCTIPLAQWRAKFDSKGSETGVML